jgi:hypothetical protein
MPVTDTDDGVLRLRMITVDPPDPRESEAVFGLQDRDRRIYAGRLEANGDVRYDFEVRARWDTGRQRLRFRGPWVHGTADAPFVYVSWRRSDPDADPAAWIRRAKISLASIRLSQVERARHAPGSVLVIRVPGRGSASVRPLEDWTLSEAADFSPIAPA